MARRAALLILLAACGRGGEADDTAGGDAASGTTQLHATIAAAPGLTLTTLAAHLQFATVDATELHVVSVPLPADLALVLPDASGAPISIAAARVRRARSAAPVRSPRIAAPATARAAPARR